MKRSVSLSIAVLMITSFCIFGCVGSEQPHKATSYYTLEYKPPGIETDTPLPFPLRIELFEAAPLYRTSKIVYKTRPFQRDFYNYHKWRANPGELVTWFLTRDLRTSGLFKAVFTTENSLQAAYFLEGTVDDFFENDMGDDWEAVLSISVLFVSEKELNRKIVFQKQYTFTEKCNSKNPRSLAEAMSTAMSRASIALLTDIKTALSVK